MICSRNQNLAPLASGFLGQSKSCHSSLQSADFFRADNPEGMEARNEVVFIYFLLLFNFSRLTASL